MFYSAQIPEHVMRDIIIWNRYYSGSLRLNTWGGPAQHNPNSCLNVFTAHGLGYGYLVSVVTTASLRIMCAFDLTAVRARAAAIITNSCWTRSMTSCCSCSRKQAMATPVARGLPLRIPHSIAGSGMAASRAMVAATVHHRRRCCRP